MKNTSLTGSIAESKVLAALVLKGYVVSIPFCVARYDLVADLGGQLVRVQCKSGIYREGALQFNATSVCPRTGSGKRYEGDADLFGVYCAELDKAYLIPVDDVVSDKPRFRVDAPKRCVTSRMKYAARYEI